MVFGLKLCLPKKASEASVEKASSKPAVRERRSGLTVNEFVARTKRSRERGLEPTKPELIAYARYLGIDAITDGDLMWIAEEALNAPLPAEWTEHHDNAERVFYYNVHTHLSSWTHPLEQLHRDTYKNIVHFRGGKLSKDEQSSELETLRSKCERCERETHQELQLWTEHTDEQNQKFYYNHEKQRSVWTDPRPALCHSLYLQMKALRVLSKHLGQTPSVRGPEPLSPEISRTVGQRRGLGEREPRDRWEKLQDDRLHKEIHGGFQRPLSNSDAQGTLTDTEDGHGDDLRKRKKRSGARVRGGSVGHTDRPPEVQGAREALKVRGARSASPVRGTLLGTSVPSPSGTDNLSNVGRAKVRAGIRLQPLEAPRNLTVANEL